MRGGNVSEPTGSPREATPCALMPAWAGEFRDFDDWVNFATARLVDAIGSQGQDVPAICVDALGRRCAIGADFQRARDEDAFPVRYFWECKPSPTATTDLLEAVELINRIARDHARGTACRIADIGGIVTDALAKVLGGA